MILRKFLWICCNSIYLYLLHSNQCQIPEMEKCSLQKTYLPYQHQKDQTLNHGSNQNIARQKFYLSIYFVFEWNPRVGWIAFFESLICCFVITRSLDQYCNMLISSWVSTVCSYVDGHRRPFILTIFLQMYKRSRKTRKIRKNMTILI